MKNSSRKTITVKVIAIVLASLFLISAAGIIISTIHAAEAEEFVLDHLDKDEFRLKPIPLLCIRISFDANGNGVDDWDPYNSTKLYADTTSEYYGEQWIHSSKGYWSNMLFSESGKSLYAYYKEMSCGSFYFYAGEETEGTANDGIVDVVLNMSHPRARITSNFTSDGGERRAALEAANEYVDFKSYDKNGNGYVDYTELAIVFIIAGYEHAYNTGGRLSSMEAFGTHAHYTSGAGIRLDDVYVTSSGKSGFVKCGEYQTTSDAITVGTVAHELGHFLGSADLYDGGDGSWSGYVGTMSLMASGSHNSGGNSRRGSIPSAIDPFHAIYIGMTGYETVRDGEYTLYSRESKEGEYNIIRVNTQNPNEYYLIENRYSSQESKFDNTQSGCQGIVIWHIDEDIFNMGKVNNANSGHDPGVVIMGKTGINSGSCAFEQKQTSTSVAYTFKAMNKNYRFPKSGTWNTSLDEGTELGLEILVLDPGGPEMKISITGTVDCPPTVSFAGSEATDSTLEFRGKITDLSGGNVTSCGFILSTNSKPTAENGIVKYVVPNADGTFSAKFEDLTQGTKYYCTVFATGNQGTGSKTTPTYTKAHVVYVEHDYYNVFMYSNYNNLARKYTKYVYPGQLLDCSMTINWAGYSFCGWYWDAALTERYDPLYKQDTKDDYSLYGKWVEETRAVKLKISGADVLYNFYAEIGDTYGVPIPKDKEGYTFDGWYADAGLTEPFDFETPVREDDDITIYAKWTSISGDDPEPTTATTVATTAATTATEETTIGMTAGETTEATTKPTTENGGCGSALSAGAIMICATMALGTVFVSSKKKKRE